jgi:hypothetical protein
MKSSNITLPLAHCIENSCVCEPKNQCCVVKAMNRNSASNCESILLTRYWKWIRRVWKCVWAGSRRFVLTKFWCYVIEFLRNGQPVASWPACQQLSVWITHEVKYGWHQDPRINSLICCIKTTERWPIDHPLPYFSMHIKDTCLVLHVSALFLYNRQGRSIFRFTLNTFSPMVHHMPLHTALCLRVSRVITLF